jgi:c-di-GMP-binding flagellar brake protein YcgR
MADNKNAQSGKIEQIFDKLIQNKTPLKMNLIEANYESLTIVTGLSKIRNIPHFCIDYPKGFVEAFAGIDVWHIRFKFSGEDKIKYVFDTTGGELIGETICLKLPEAIERQQRRKLFRINAPSGTTITINVKSIQQELKVIDISLGGVLLALNHADEHVWQKPAFTPANRIEDIELVFPLESGSERIQIKKSRVRRLKKNPDTKKYELALEFDEMSRRDEDLLTESIYRLQREFLRKRLPLDA